MAPAEKRWKRFEPLLADGDWHVHSRWSNDAKGTIAEHCERARDNGLKLVAFTEHVRRKILFDFAAFSAEVEQAREQFPDLVILHGCEAKVLDASGAIDVSDDVLARCDIVVGSFHSFADRSAYVPALENMLRNPHVDIWGHPTLYAVKNGITLDAATVDGLIDLCMAHEVLIEFNAKYGLPSDAVRARVIERGARYVYGSDAHRPDALRTPAAAP